MRDELSGKRAYATARIDGTDDVLRRVRSGGRG
jgi:hypothetical protein